MTNFASLPGRIQRFAVATCLTLVLPAQSLTSYAGEIVKSLPADVSAYVKHRDNCDALRGDIPEPDPADPDNLNRVIRDINQYCKGTDRQLKQLKDKYCAVEGVMSVLSGYEENIEADMSFQE